MSSRIKEVTSPRIGDTVLVRVARIAHGGHCVGYREDLPDGERGPTIFVRHALPGELVRVIITDRTSKMVRADAIEIIEASPIRVPPPCRHSGPNGCGGCDFQHVSIAGQRALKQEVLRDALKRFASIDETTHAHLNSEVQVIDGYPDGLHWRSRVTYAQSRDGQWGLHAHHSHRVVPVETCLVGSAGAGVPGENRTDLFADVGDRHWRIPAEVFWQPHLGAPEALVSTVLEFAQPRSGETWWDLYAGAGLFSAFLGEAVGPTGRVDSVESAAPAMKSARRALHDLPQVVLHEREVDDWIGAMALVEAPAGVVLDPPRSGAKAHVMEAIGRLRPRVVVYVACDPVALARDAAVLEGAGYRLDEIRAFDAFPMTHHLETVARFTSSSPAS